jgi:hypothetical protein
LPGDEDYLKNVAKTISKKGAIEEIKFEYLTDALKALGISEDPYSLISIENLNPEPVQSLIEKSFLKINSIELTDNIKNKLFLLWDYLSESDALEKAGLIFVFGGPGMGRVHKAIELYKNGYAEKILFTGCRSSYMKDTDSTEAEYYADIAEKEGVASDDIILETEAKNTPENAVNSVKILKEKSILPEKIILITLPYHMRRSYLTFKSVADWNPKLIKQPASSDKFVKEVYFTDKNAWSYIFNEFIKLYGARLMQHF